MDQDNRTPTNLRLLMIIETLADAGEPLTPTEINRNIGLPKPSIHRLCNTLVAEGYLIRDADPKKLRPARRLRTMATRILAASHVHIARHQVLVDIVEQTRETVNFVISDDDGMRYLDRVEADWPLRIQLPVGSSVPFHCTASGKCFLASMSPKMRRDFVACINLKPMTTNTITDGVLLLEEIEAVRANGFAIDNEEFIEGMTAVAVPVTDREGNFIAAIAVHGPQTRMQVDGLPSKAGILRAGAEKIVAELY